MASDPALVDVQAIERAGVVVTCRDFAANLAFFTESLGFRVETIHPADGPTHASIIGHACRLYLEVGVDEPVHIRLTVNPTICTLEGLVRRNDRKFPEYMGKIILYTMISNGSESMG